MCFSIYFSLAALCAHFVFACKCRFSDFPDILFSYFDTARAANGQPLLNAAFYQNAVCGGLGVAPGEFFRSRRSLSAWGACRLPGERQGCFPGFPVYPGKTIDSGSIVSDWRKHACEGILQVDICFFCAKKEGDVSRETSPSYDCYQSFFAELSGPFSPQNLQIT